MVTNHTGSKNKTGAIYATCNLICANFKNLYNAIWRENKLYFSNDLFLTLGTWNGNTMPRKWARPHTVTTVVKFSHQDRQQKKQHKEWRPTPCQQQITWGDKGQQPKMKAKFTGRSSKKQNHNPSFIISIFSIFFTHAWIRRSLCWPAVCIHILTC